MNKIAFRKALLIIAAILAISPTAYGSWKTNRDIERSVEETLENVVTQKAYIEETLPVDDRSLTNELRAVEPENVSDQPLKVEPHSEESENLDDAEINNLGFLYR